MQISTDKISLFRYILYLFCKLTPPNPKCGIIGYIVGSIDPAKPVPLMLVNIIYNSIVKGIIVSKIPILNVRLINNIIHDAITSGNKTDIILPVFENAKCSFIYINIEIL